MGRTDERLARYAERIENKSGGPQKFKRTIFALALVGLACVAGAAVLFADGHASLANPLLTAGIVVLLLQAFNAYVYALRRRS